MNHIKKYIVLSLFMLIVLFVSCNVKEEQLSFVKTKEESTLIEESLLDTLKDYDYEVLDPSFYTINAIEGEYFDNFTVVESVQTLSKIDCLNEDFKKNLISDYEDAFFAHHVLFLFSKYDTYSFTISNVVLSNDGIILLYQTGEEKWTNKTYVIEIDLSGFTINKEFNYLKNYTPTLFKENYINYYIYSYEELSDLLNNKKTNQLLWNKIEEDETYPSLMNKDELDANLQTLSQIYITQSNVNDLNDEKRNGAIFTIKKDYCTYSFYQNGMCQAKYDETFKFGKIVKGNPYYLVPSLLNEESNTYSFTMNMINMLLNGMNNHLITSSYMNTLVPIILKVNEWEAPYDFASLTILEQLDLIISDADLLTSSEATLLKKKVNQFKTIFKDYLNDEMNFKVYFKLTIESEDGEKLKEMNVYYGKHIVLEAINKDDSLYLGAFYKDYRFKELDYSLYQDFTLIAKYTSSDNFVLETKEDGVYIKEYIGTEERVYTPWYDSKGEEIKGISEKAFINNNTIIYLDIDNEVIGASAFEGCSLLETIVLHPSIKQIDALVFNGCEKLVNVCFEEGLTLLGESMFKNCVSIDSIMIPASMTDLSKTVFDGCDGLGSLMVDYNNPKFQGKNNCIMMDTTLYYGCKNSSIPDGTVFLADHAFLNIKTLYTIVIPSTVVHIDTGCFQGCSGLIKVYIPQSVMYNAEDTFNTGTNTIIECEYGERMSGWHKNWTSGTTVYWDVKKENNE